MSGLALHFLPAQQLAVWTRKGLYLHDFVAADTARGWRDRGNPRIRHRSVGFKDDIVIRLANEGMLHEGHPVLLINSRHEKTASAKLKKIVMRLGTIAPTLNWLSFAPHAAFPV